MRVLVFSTPDGEGEAIQWATGDPWVVSSPYGDFRFYGTVTRLKRLVKEYCNCDVEWL